MLGRLGNNPIAMHDHGAASHPAPSRNEKEDMKLAIEYLYEFRDKLSKLHHVCVDAIENMLQRPRY